MSTYLALAVIVALSGRVSVSPADAATPPSPDTITISNSGATNVKPFDITIARDGTAHVVVGERSVPLVLDKALVQKLFVDVAAAKASTATPEPCMKSASFGTTTHVAWNGWTSPDMECAPDAPAFEALGDDIERVENESETAIHHRSLAVSPGAKPYLEG